jgi:uncharacterized protein (DUF2147 family)
MLRHSTLLAIALIACTPAFAADLTPVGTWTTIDDATGKPKSVVQISERDGKLEGKVLQVLDSEDGPHPLCKECKDERKDQPVEGMTIIWGVAKNGDVWDGGYILDPHNGKTYKVKLSMADNGQKLDVHGYIGISLLGRSQMWERRPGQ